MVFKLPDSNFVDCRLFVIIYIIIVEDVILDISKKREFIALCVDIEQELHHVRQKMLRKIFEIKIISLYDILNIC